MNVSPTPVLSEQPIQIFCQYQNYTSSIQVVCISDVPNRFFERTVFSGQMLFFQASATAVLEVRTGISATAIASDRIPCHRLVSRPHTPFSKAAWRDRCSTLIIHEDE